MDPEDEEWGANEADEPGKHSVLIARLAVPVSVATALVVALIAGLMPGTSQGSAADPAGQTTAVATYTPGGEGDGTTPSAGATTSASAAPSSAGEGIAHVLLPPPVDTVSPNDPAEATASAQDPVGHPSATTTAPRTTPPPTKAATSNKPTTASTTTVQQTQPTQPATQRTTSAPVQQSTVPAVTQPTQPVVTQPAPTVAAPTTQPPPEKKAPIVITGVDTGTDNVCYPLVRGTAQPGSTVVVSGGGASQTVTANSSGAWSTDRLTAVKAGVTPITASDPSGQVASASGNAIVAAAPIVSVTYQNGLLLVSVNGKAGATAVVLLDGTEIGTIAIGSDRQGELRYTTTLSPGSHSVGLFYRASGCVGPTMQTDVTA